MSELANTRNGARNLRWNLLATASSIALVGMFGANDAGAADQDTERPTVWIELGGQLEHPIGQDMDFAPAFLANNADAPVFKPISPLQAQKAPYFFDHGLEGKLTFEPEGSDWIFSAAIRYGRSNRNRHVHQQSFAPLSLPTLPNAKNYEANFADTVAKEEGSSAIVDFSVGKDVGLGVFGEHGTSVLNAGVRFAQFSSNTDTVIRARPNVKVNGLFARTFHNYYLDGAADRSFVGVGPSLSWNASAALAGHPDTTEAVLDFGVNGAVLFGRQKTKAHHQTTGVYHRKYTFFSARYVQTYSKNGHRTNDRSIITPNIGGFVAISVRRSVAAVNFGYRADFFFGAVDNGIVARKSGMLGFSGPYATISVGFP